jgi:hypothetical protein
MLMQFPEIMKRSLEYPVGPAPFQTEGKFTFFLAYHLASYPRTTGAGGIFGDWFHCWDTRQANNHGSS